MIELTIFKYTRDNKTNNKLGVPDWPWFVNMLKTLSKQVGYKPKQGEFKLGSSLISPAVYSEGTTRSNVNVEYWGKWAALDVDMYEGTFEEALAKYKDYEYVCYSTASSTLEHPKFRVVFPLTDIVSKKQIKGFWYAINKNFGEDGDPQTKDMSRMYYVPAVYPDAHNFFIENKGKWIEPDKMMEQWPWVDRGETFFDRLPESIQKTLIARKKDEMTNNTFKWNSFKDCPFVNKKLVMQYAVIAEGGWYHMMYKIMVSTASSALYHKYPITSVEIATLCREIDRANGDWYGERPFEIEADRAIEYAYRNTGVI